MGRDTFKDNATTKIIAFDFDNTLTVGDLFPNIGQPRKYAKEVMNLLYDLGVTVLIWTCRDTTKRRVIDDPDFGIRVEPMYDDQAPMIRWLGEHGFKYHDINNCIKYAPFHYEARKIYAHMYVDDRAFGWRDIADIMIYVLDSFLRNHMGYCPSKAMRLCEMIVNGEEIDIEWAKIKHI